MEKRVILFLILSLAIIFGYDYLLKRLGYLPTSEQPEQSSSAPGSADDSKSGPARPDDARHPSQPRSSPGDRSTRAGATPSASQPSPAQAPSVGEETVEVVTDLYRARFTNRGATLTSWQLARFLTKTTGGEPVQLIHGGDSFPEPLSLRTVDPQVGDQLANATYRVVKDFTTLDAEHPSGTLTFRYESPDGNIRVEKRLTFHHGSYAVDVAIRTEGLQGDLEIGLGTNFGIVEWSQGFIGLIGPAVMIDGAIEKDTPEAEVVRTGNIRWLALQDKYFLSVFIPRDPAAVRLKKEGDELVSAALTFAGPKPASELALTLYAGPKEFDTLHAMGVGLEQTIDFGWFIYGSWSLVRAVAQPLFYLLRFLYDYLNNYGLVIVVLTMGIKLLFVPLQYKSYKSMKQMQFVQPKVVELQKKYQDDRERMNQELLKLYREHKVNPVGGCLPMVMQMPVFVALFNILYMTIDLRHAPFVLWITDLSSQDPYYILPVLMGVSMVVQQKIMPTTMDPAQARMMLLVPAFMTLLFLNFPAGLVLYWLTNNLLTIGQQVFTDRYFSVAAPPGISDERSSGDGGPRPGKKRKDPAPEKPEKDSRVEA